MSSIIPFSAARGGKSATRARRAPGRGVREVPGVRVRGGADCEQGAGRLEGGEGGVHEFYSSIFYRQGRKERHQSAESLHMGYGKCPEFVCVDGLIVGRSR